MSPGRTDSHEHYTVAIVGGGIAGLTMAMALEQLNIDYILFEAYHELAPQQGASIGMQPSAQRVLDQLGLMPELLKHGSPMKRWRHQDGEGNLLMTSTIHTEYSSRIGYNPLIFTRTKLLEILLGGIKDTTPLKTSAKVTSVEEHDEYALVTTEDGTTVSADLVVGADGIRSVVRNYIDKANPQATKTLDDCFSTRFSCAWGVSRPASGVIPGECFAVYNAGITALVFMSLDGNIYWFLMEDLEQDFPFSETPRFRSEEDMARMRQRGASIRVTDDLTFADLYACSTSVVKTALEEGIAPNWHSDRLVLIGDSAHKMTPSAAMGAGQAIESAALLVNHLRAVMAESPGSSINKNILRMHLKQYADAREPRARQVQELAGAITAASLKRRDPASQGMINGLSQVQAGDILFRDVMLYAGSPVLNDFGLSESATQLQSVLESVRGKAKARGEGKLQASNAVIVGLEA